MGNEAILSFLEHKSEPGWAKRRVIHPGMFNAKSMKVQDWLVCRKCADPRVKRTADKLAANIRRGINTLLEQRGSPG